MWLKLAGVSPHTVRSAGIHCVIVTDTSPTVPLHPHTRSQGHDESSKNKMDTGEKRKLMKMLFFFLAQSPPTPRSTHCHKTQIHFKLPISYKASHFYHKSTQWLSSEPTGKWPFSCRKNDKINRHLHLCDLKPLVLQRPVRTKAQRWDILLSVMAHSPPSLLQAILQRCVGLKKAANLSALNLTVWMIHWLWWAEVRSDATLW